MEVVQEVLVVMVMIGVVVCLGSGIVVPGFRQRNRLFSSNSDMIVGFS